MAQHPDPKTLRAFALGQLAGKPWGVVAAHIEQCPDCTRFLDQPHSDSLLDQLRRTDVDTSPDRSTPASNQADKPSLPRETANHSSFDRLAALFEQQSRYRLIRPLGIGGMGAVYLARHSIMGRDVAIKVIREELVANPQAVARFQQEVRTAARLSHKNIVAAWDADQVNGVHFLVTEYIDGENLRDTIRRKGKGLSVMRVINYVLQVTMGLRHAHQVGMIHRDIKPHNLMKTRQGVVKIMDFGLARVRSAGSSTDDLTTPGMLMGTADYMAPEQAQDATRADIRSDLYSLGCTFYYLLAGQPPFAQTFRVDKLIAHRSEPFPDIRDLRPDVPQSVVQIIGRMTAKSPKNRYQTPDELIGDLKPLLASSATIPEVAISSGEPRSPDKTNLGVPASIGIGASGEPVRPLPGRPDQARTLPSAIGSNPRWADRRKLLTIAAVGAGLLGLGTLGLRSQFFSAANHHTDGNAEQKPKRDENTRRNNSSGASSTTVSPGSDGEPSLAPPTNRPTILALLSAQRFWFSDFAPLESAARENQIRLVTTSDRIGLAQYNPQDTIGGKHPVTISRAVADWSNEQLRNIDAVYLMGDSITEFSEGGASGEEVRRLLEQIQSNGGWIVAVGKGISIPGSHGLLDDIDVSASSWISPRAAERSEMNLIESRVVVDEDARVMTADGWTSAEELVERMIARLTQEQSP